MPTYQSDWTSRRWIAGRRDELTQRYRFSFGLSCVHFVLSCALILQQPFLLRTRKAAIPARQDTTLGYGVL